MPQATVVPRVNQKVKYVGKKEQYWVQFPLPYLSKSEAEGSPMCFAPGQVIELSPEKAGQLCKHSPVYFKMVDDNGKELKHKVEDAE